MNRTLLVQKHNRGLSQNAWRVDTNGYAGHTNKKGDNNKSTPSESTLRKVMLSAVDEQDQSGPGDQTLHPHLRNGKPLVTTGNHTVNTP